jgi:hypothetical protein
MFIGRLLLALVLFWTSAVFAELAPRLVKKSGDVEVPPGMHLVRDRTGARWILPEDMTEPPEREIEVEYFKTREKPKIIGRIGNHQILSGPISAEEAVVSTHGADPQNLMKRLPKDFADLMSLEKEANRHAQTSNDLKALGLFGPGELVTFKVPYIPIPADQFEFAKISGYARPETRALLEFEKVVDGRMQKFYRFFIHPNYVKSYAELIGRFGVVYHYDALTSSSPRSLIVMDSEKPTEVHWVKVSLHKKLDGSVRINTDKKARRAIIMSEAIHEVPRADMKSYGVDFMLEPAAFQPKGKIASTIIREVADELLHPKEGIKWIPAFILQNTGEYAIPGLNLEDMIRASGLSPGDFVQNRIVRPLLRSYLAMGLKEGLPGELHTQNFYYELKKTTQGYLPTGRVMFKDNDGFRYDTELALRAGRNMRFFAEFDQPFAWGKFSNTLGTGAEGIPFIGSWYYKLIRNVNGFETLSAYMMRALQQIDPQGQWDKDRVQLMFDDIAAEEAHRVTGISIGREDYGFGADKGLNKVLGIHRARLSMEAITLQRENFELQEALKQEWMRLRELERVSALRRSLSAQAYYLVHEMRDGSMIIEARTPKTSIDKPDPTIGFAMMEAESRESGLSAAQQIRALKNRSNQKTNGVSRTTVPSGAAQIGMCRGVML